MMSCVGGVFEMFQSKSWSPRCIRRDADDVKFVNANPACFVNFIFTRYVGVVSFLWLYEYRMALVSFSVSHDIYTTNATILPDDKDM